MAVMGEVGVGMGVVVMAAAAAAAAVVEKEEGVEVEVDEVMLSFAAWTYRGLRPEMVLESQQQAEGAKHVALDPDILEPFFRVA